MQGLGLNSAGLVWVLGFKVHLGSSNCSACFGGVYDFGVLGPPGRFATERP